MKYPDSMNLVFNMKDIVTDSGLDIDRVKDILKKSTYRDITDENNMNRAGMINSVSFINNYVKFNISLTTIENISIYEYKFFIKSNIDKLHSTITLGYKKV